MICEVKQKTIAPYFSHIVKGFLIILGRIEVYLIRLNSLNIKDEIC